MHAFAVLIPLLASSALAYHHHDHQALQERAAVKYTTITTKVTTSQTTNVPLTIQQDVGPGTSVFIPGILTMTFQGDGYIYLETVTPTTKLVTTKITTKIPITSTAKAASAKLSPPPSSSTVKSTSVTKAAINPTTVTVAGTEPTSVHYTNDCPSYCGSGRTCVNGQCYYFATDNQNCGAPGYVCGKGADGHQLNCYQGRCWDYLTDTYNCGEGGYICSYDGSYVCQNGQCVAGDTSSS